MRAKKMQSWVNENMDKYVTLMNLKDWRIRVTIVDQKHPANKYNDEELPKKRGFCAAGDCRSFYEYKLARIRLFAKQIHNEECLKRVLVHELAHVATSSFFLFVKYFSKEVLFTSCKQVASRIQTDVCELLAIQIENIILGQDKNIVNIQSHAAYIEDDLRVACLNIKSCDLNNKVISDLNDKTPKSAENILWEEKKEDENFWYEKWSKARDLKHEKEREQEGEKVEYYSRKNGLIFPPTQNDKDKYISVKLILPFKNKSREDEL